MISLTVVALIRLVPYLFAALNAWTKGYKWLTIATIFVSVLAVVNFFVKLPSEWVGFLSSIFALLLLMHSLDLKPKNK